MANEHGVRARVYFYTRDLARSCGSPRRSNTASWDSYRLISTEVARRGIKEFGHGREGSVTGFWINGLKYVCAGESPEEARGAPGDDPVGQARYSAAGGLRYLASCAISALRFSTGWCRTHRHSVVNSGNRPRLSRDVAASWRACWAIPGRRLRARCGCRSCMDSFCRQAAGGCRLNTQESGRSWGRRSWRCHTATHGADRHAGAAELAPLSVELAMLYAARPACRKLSPDARVGAQRI